MTGNELRQAYLQFFENKGHLKLDSFSLVPENDPSLLLIGAGMAPLKPFFTGKLVPPRTRMRTGDLENVGRTARHHTFFEMLGNFSFGDYFKHDAIHWAWEFLTEVIKLDKNKLYVTVYPDDQEAYDTWHKECGVEESHISRLDDNFWEIGEGPCGPDSEIFYDLGPERGCGEPGCAPGCDCDRYLEIWNLVFTQFNKQADGSYVPLEKKNIDTGAGLERLASVLQNCESNFETDLIFPIIEAAAKKAGVTYHTDADTDVSLKVIADHTRAVTALISDGVLPSNEGRGYVLRRILRRAVRHGRLLGIEGPFLVPLIDVVVDILGPGIASIAEKKDFVKRVVANEEERFNQTLAQGLSLLSDLVEDLKAKGADTIPGTDVFKLYDTYGFPWELTEEIAAEGGLAIDKEGFDAAMAEQRTRAREARVDQDAKVATPDITFLANENLTE
ncbi:MAG: alanine--tRNA ligase, partial [Veillonella sp.]|nr:alanine--tRNA ligase [Veillonella sp.]